MQDHQTWCGSTSWGGEVLLGIAFGVTDSMVKATVGVHRILVSAGVLARVMELG